MHLKIKVHPGAKDDNCRRLSWDTFEISIKNKPQRNEANHRMVEMLADHLEIRPSQIRVVSGHHGRRKIVEILFGELSS